MFRCQVCQAVSPPHTPSHRLVVATRTKKYPLRPKANLVVRRNAADTRWKRREVDDPGGLGFEIVRELIVCGICVACRGEI